MKRALFFTVFLVFLIVSPFAQEVTAPSTPAPAPETAPASAPASTPAASSAPVTAPAQESAPASTSASVPAAASESTPATETASAAEPEPARGPSRSIFFEGSAEKEEHLEFFTVNFKMEAEVLGYYIAENKSDAGYIFKFKVEPNTVLHNDGTRHPAPPDDNQFVIFISLIRNTDDFEILNFNFYFSDLLEMYNYTQTLFLKAAVLIPPADPVIQRETVTVLQDRRPDTRWKNKMFYIRASFDYPITFYILQSDGLVGQLGVYKGDYDNPDRVSPEDHKIMAMPGFTFGIETQFLNFMSLEMIAQLSFGDTRNNTFLNASIGTDIKFPLKFFTNFLITPYLGITFPVTVSDVFDKFPILGLGGGLQAGVKSGKNGSIFLDARYMYFIGKAGMSNPYGDLFPNPEVIYYKRQILGFGLGYKFGFIDRRSR